MYGGERNIDGVEIGLHMWHLESVVRESIRAMQAARRHINIDHFLTIYAKDACSSFVIQATEPRRRCEGGEHALQKESRYKQDLVFIRSLVHIPDTNPCLQRMGRWLVGGRQMFLFKRLVLHTLETAVLRKKHQQSCKLPHRDVCFPEVSFLTFRRG